MHDVARHDQHVGMQTCSAAGDGMEPLLGHVAAGVEIGKLDDPDTAPSPGKACDRDGDPLPPQNARPEERPVEREPEGSEREPHRHRRRTEVRDGPARAEDRVEEAAQPEGCPGCLHRRREKPREARALLPAEDLGEHREIEREQESRHGQAEGELPLGGEPAHQIGRRHDLRQQGQTQDEDVEARPTHL